MKRDAEMRCDVAVVMARGDSVRMGFAKGLARLPDDERTFAERIVDLYLEVDWPVLLVASEQTATDYAKALDRRTKVEVIAGPRGGDTAATLALARAALPSGWSHLWAHPVDLPLVTAAVRDRLVESSRAAPTEVLRPVWHRTPGHPVVLPVAALDHLRSEPTLLTGPMRELLAGHWTGIPVDDPGVIRDFDDPAGLAASGPDVEEGRP